MTNWYREFSDKLNESSDEIIAINEIDNFKKYMQKTFEGLFASGVISEQALIALEGTLNDYNSEKPVEEEIVSGTSPLNQNDHKQLTGQGYQSTGTTIKANNNNIDFNKLERELKAPKGSLAASKVGNDVQIYQKNK